MTVAKQKSRRPSLWIPLLFTPFLILIVFLQVPVPDHVLSFQEVASLRIFDRNGILLREILSRNQGRGKWIREEELPPLLKNMVIFSEDRRFYAHDGVDPIAIIRAVHDNLRAGGIVSGASTITQQVVKNLYDLPRSFWFKIIEAFYAVRLENTLSKQEILEQYLNRIPFGNQTFGIEAAARLYFNKSARKLSPAETAFLIALPKSPTAYNPYRNFSRAKARQMKILFSLKTVGLISEPVYTRASREPLVLFPQGSPFLSPHFTQMVAQSYADRLEVVEVKTTLDLNLQDQIQGVLDPNLEALKNLNVTNASVLVIDNQSGDVRAMVGSRDFFDESIDGQVNGTLALRQPGSALKPFTYGTAFELGFTPATLVADVKTEITTERGKFTPRNYDGTFHGPVRIRTALASSYNVPAVRIMQKIGVEALLGKLRVAGFESLDFDPQHYGHGLTLGNGEVTLLELTTAYSLFPNQGELYPSRFVIRENGAALASEKSSRQVFEPEVAFLVTDILSDMASRSAAFGYSSDLDLPIDYAVKTGTSSNFRDNWAIGFTSRYTVGVWAGNFDGSSMRGVSGVTGAVPIFRDVMMLLHHDLAPEPFQRPPGIVKRPVCSYSGQTPSAFCKDTYEELFIDSHKPDGICSIHLSADGPRLPIDYTFWARETGLEQPASNDLERPLIVFPKNGDSFKIDPSIDPEIQGIYFHVLVPEGITGITWRLDGRDIGSVPQPFSYLWQLEAGEHLLIAIPNGTKNKKSQPVHFSVLK